MAVSAVCVQRSRTSAGVSGRRSSSREPRTSPATSCASSSIRLRGIGANGSARLRLDECSGFRVVAAGMTG